MLTMSNRSTKARLYYGISTESMNRLDEISKIENIPKFLMVEKLIMSYVPVPPPEGEHELRAIYVREIKLIRRLNPYAIFLNVTPNTQDGSPVTIPYAMWLDWKNGIITWEELTRKYIECLQTPAAQERIADIQRYRKTNDVYITGFEVNKEFALRKLFVEYLKGKLIWK